MPTLKLIDIGPWYQDSINLPSETLQLTATGYYDDYSTADLTSSVTWASSNSHLPVSSGGLLSIDSSYIVPDITYITATVSGVTGKRAFSSATDRGQYYTINTNIYVGQTAPLKVFYKSLTASNRTVYVNDSTSIVDHTLLYPGIDLTSLVTSWAVFDNTMTAMPSINYTIDSSGNLTCHSFLSGSPETINIQVVITGWGTQTIPINSLALPTWTTSPTIQTIITEGGTYGLDSTGVALCANGWYNAEFGFIPDSVSSDNTAVLEVVRYSSVFGGNTTFIVKGAGTAKVIATATVGVTTYTVTVNIVECTAPSSIANYYTSPVTVTEGEQIRSDVIFSFPAISFDESPNVTNFLPGYQTCVSDTTSVAIPIDPVCLGDTIVPQVGAVAAGSATITDSFFAYNGYDRPHALLNGLLNSAAYTASYTLDVLDPAPDNITALLAFDRCGSMIDDVSSVSAAGNPIYWHSTFTNDDGPQHVTLVVDSSSTDSVTLYGVDNTGADISEIVTFAGTSVTSTKTYAHLLQVIPNETSTPRVSGGFNGSANMVFTVGSAAHSGTLAGVTVTTPTAPSAYVAKTTITLDSSASTTDNIYDGMIVVATSGTGAGGLAIISNYTGSSKQAQLASYPVRSTEFDSTTVVSLYQGGFVGPFGTGIFQHLFYKVFYPVTGSRTYCDIVGFQVKGGYLYKSKLRVTDPTGLLTWAYDSGTVDSTIDNRLSGPPVGLEFGTSDISLPPLTPSTIVWVWLQLPLNSSVTPFDESLIKVEVIP